MNTKTDTEVIPVFTKEIRSDFISKYKYLFEKLTDQEAINILIAIWNFGDERWKTGYNQGYTDPNFENES